MNCTKLRKAKENILNMNVSIYESKIIIIWYRRIPATSCRASCAPQWWPAFPGVSRLCLWIQWWLFVSSDWSICSCSCLKNAADPVVGVGPAACSHHLWGGRSPPCSIALWHWWDKSRGLFNCKRLDSTKTSGLLTWLCVCMSCSPVWTSEAEAPGLLRPLCPMWLLDRSNQSIRTISVGQRSFPVPSSERESSRVSALPSPSLSRDDSSAWFRLKPVWVLFNSWQTFLLFFK